MSRYHIPQTPEALHQNPDYPKRAELDFVSELHHATAGSIEAVESPIRNSEGEPVFDQDIDMIYYGEHPAAEGEHHFYGHHTAGIVKALDERAFPSGVMELVGSRDNGTLGRATMKQVGDYIDISFNVSGGGLGDPRENNTSHFIFKGRFEKDNPQSEQAVFAEGLQKAREAFPDIMARLEEEGRDRFDRPTKRNQPVTIKLASTEVLSPGTKEPRFIQDIPTEELAGLNQVKIKTRFRAESTSSEGGIRHNIGRLLYDLRETVDMTLSARLAEIKGTMLEGHPIDREKLVDQVLDASGREIQLALYRCQLSKEDEALIRSQARAYLLAEDKMQWLEDHALYGRELSDIARNDELYDKELDEKQAILSGTAEPESPEVAFEAQEPGLGSLKEELLSYGREEQEKKRTARWSGAAALSGWFGEKVKGIKAYFAGEDLYDTASSWRAAPANEADVKSVATPEAKLNPEQEARARKLTLERAQAALSDATSWVQGQIYRGFSALTTTRTGATVEAVVASETGMPSIDPEILSKGTEQGEPDTTEKKRMSWKTKTAIALGVVVVGGVSGYLAYRYGFAGPEADTSPVNDLAANNPSNVGARVDVIEPPAPPAIEMPRLSPEAAQLVDGSNIWQSSERLLRDNGFITDNLSQKEIQQMIDAVKDWRLEQMHISEAEAASLQIGQAMPTMSLGQLREIVAGSIAR